MRDIMGMMGKVKEMQSKMEKVQEEIAALEVEGRAGGGLVTVILNGKGEMRSLKIDPSLLKEDEVEILTSPIDLAEYKEAIMNALYKGAKRNVFSEESPKNAVAP